MHFCSKPVFDRFVIKPVRGTQMKKKVEKQTKVPVEDRREGKLNYNQNPNADSSCNASDAAGHWATLPGFRASSGS